MGSISRRNILKGGVLSMAVGLTGAVGSGFNSKQRSLKIMVVGAHPDDPETGCGGLIALSNKAGHEVVVGYLTKGEAGIPGKTHEEAADIRTKEALAACEIMGARPVFLGQVDGDTAVTRKDYRMMTEFIKKEAPDILLTHWPIDTHMDHRACSNLTYGAWLALEKKPELYFYEVMTGIQSRNFNPTDYIDITDVVEIKHWACFIHQSQGIEEGYPNDHGKMEVFRGMEGGFQFAEGYVRHSRNLSGLPGKA